MRHLWSLLCKTLSFSLCLSLSLSSVGAELADLYQAEVDANQSQSQWQQAAVSAVLIKLTGSTQILENQSVKSVLRSSSDFIKQFQMIQRDGRNLLQVRLDQQKISSLLQQLQIPIWGSRRPDVLIWLTEKTLEEPQLVVLAAHPLRNALNEQAKTYGLSFLYPRYDEQDLALVNASALWSGDWTGLSLASPRYQATQVFNLLVEQQIEMTGQLQYRLTSQTLVDGTLQNQEFIGPDVATVLLQFSQQLAAEQAAKYAVNVQAGTAADGTLQLTLEGISSLTDLVSAQKLFSSMLTVRQQQLEEFQPGIAKIRLTLAASEQDFYRALALEKQLQPVLTTTSDAAVAEDNFSTTPDATSASDENALSANASTEPQTTAEPRPEISEAEQALEAALSGDNVQTTDVPADVAAEVAPSVVPNMPSSSIVIPTGHTHFRFVRP